MRRGIRCADAPRSVPGARIATPRHLRNVSAEYRDTHMNVASIFDLCPEKLAEPLKLRSSKMIFVNSMSDLFHDGIPDEYICEVAGIMMKANWHTYQVLTKRSERMASLLQTKLQFATQSAHIWWGVSVENRADGLPRIDHLRSAPAGIRFLSVEPLLEDLGDIDLSGIDWVIAGGESGRRARPMKEEWLRRLRDTCRDQGIAFFFKQWGGVQKAKNGRTLDGRTYDEFPAVPCRRGL